MTTFNLGDKVSWKSIAYGPPIGTGTIVATYSGHRMQYGVMADDHFDNPIFYELSLGNESNQTFDPLYFKEMTFTDFDWDEDLDEEIEIEYKEYRLIEPYKGYWFYGESLTKLIIEYSPDQNGDLEEDI